MSGRPTRKDLETARRCAESLFTPPPDAEGVGFPISFRYDGRESATFLRDWQRERTAGAPAPGRERETIAYRDPATGLECRCEVTRFTDFPALEWVAYFANRGCADTPIIADIQALDVELPVVGNKPIHVHHATGSSCEFDDFAPQMTRLWPDGRIEWVAQTGKSSSRHLPFFNIETGSGGVIGAIGWTGGWRARFSREGERVRIQAGLERTHLRLYPGEEIRTPRILLLLWEDDRLHGHNMLRQLILAHYTPRPNGRLLQPPIVEAVWGERSEEVQLAKIRWLVENQIPVEAFWIDAGWYGDRPFSPDTDTFGPEWAAAVGDWFPLPAAYPHGLRPIGAALRKAGLGFVLWFEPERAVEGTALQRAHPEWFLGPQPSSWLRRSNWMLNLGHPEARRAITEHISALIEEAGITIYRQDFNLGDVPDFWAAADAPDRVGMTEIRHIEGLYAFWDELLARHPGLIIDNCAGGGQRIDLETISRSVPLWRSDIQCDEDFDPIAMQTQTQGLALWVPLSAGCCREPTAYACRSALGPGMVVAWTNAPFERGATVPVAKIRALMAEAAAVRECFYGDFYPLLSFSMADDAWAAWQFDRPDLGAGVVLAFRRQKSPFRHMEAVLHGLDPDAEYTLRSTDDGSVTTAAGRVLMTAGFPIRIDDRPGAALYLYTRLPGA